MPATADFYELRDLAEKAFDRFDSEAAIARLDADHIAACVSDRRNQYGGPYSVYQTTDAQAEAADIEAERLREIATTLATIMSAADDLGWAIDPERAAIEARAA